MKILTSDEIRELDQYTIVNEPVLSIDLMERAAKTVKRWIVQNLNDQMVFHIFCGTGDNGGDGMALARLLKKDGFDIKVHLVKFSTNLSLDCSINEKKLKGLVNINYISSAEDMPKVLPGEIIIDAVFGSGLNRACEGVSELVIRYINSLECPVVSIDVPSGMFCNHANPDGEVVHADVTLSFQLPKLSFLVPENEALVGQWRVLDIGLSQKGLEEAQNTFNYVLPQEVMQIPQFPSKFSHKGENGHGLLIAGSKGKAGASFLSAKASLKSGIGLLTAVVPEVNLNVLQTSIPEAMCSVNGKDVVDSYPELDSYHAVAVGPGLGVTKETIKMLGALLDDVKQPLILDADAINILAEDKSLLERLPRNTILTPHIGEFDRLMGASSDSFERFEKQIELAVNSQLVVILKGAHTAIATPDGQIYFNSSGNPGMATAGSGDVLTGVLLSLVAQGYHALDASILGVYLHGLAGDMSLQRESYESMIASDIISNLGSAFKEILGQNTQLQKAE